MLLLLFAYSLSAFGITLKDCEDGFLSNTSPFVEQTQIGAVSLKTNRFILTPVTKAETDKIAEILVDNAVKGMSGDSFEHSDVAQLIARGVQSVSMPFNEGMVINFGIHDGVTMVGMVQLAFRKPLDPTALDNVANEGERWFEVSYYLAKNYWGQGVASEVVPSVVKVAFEDLHADGLHALAISSNVASEKILLKSGMHFVAEREAPMNPGGAAVKDKYYVLRKP